MKVKNDKIIRFIIFCIAIAVLTGGSSLFASAAEETTGTITANIDRTVRSVNYGTGDIGVYIIDADTGRVIYEHNHKKALIPASCNKLLTTSAALYYLGPQYTYTTKLVHFGGVKKKILHGNLMIIGSGDPTISGRFHPKGDKDDVVWIFRRWARQLKEKGIKTIYGNVIGNDDIFDDEYFGKAWPAGERGEWYCAEVSGLSFNDNCIDVHFRGGRKPGKVSEASIVPDTDYVTFLNAVRTVEKDGRLRIRFARKDKSNIIHAEGTIPVKRDVTDWATVYNPTAYCARVLLETFEKNGIKIKGKAYDYDNVNDEVKNPDDYTLLQTYASPPMSAIVKVINRNSQNFYAEQVLKTIGKEVNNEGAFIAGGRTVIDFLQEENIYVPGTLMVDGSGLSRMNKVSPAQLVKLLQFMKRHPQERIFFESLPQGGTSGTLKSRFQDTLESRTLAPHIHGKTGYLGGVNSLTGYVETRGGQEIFYSIIINATVLDSSMRLDIIDSIVLALAERNYI